MEGETHTPTGRFDARQARRPRRRRSDSLRIPTVRVVAGADLLASYAIYPTERVIVGRDPDCDLVLTDPSVSRRHATLHWQDGTLYVEDLGSTNGTTLEGTSPIQGRSELTMGRLFYVGNVALRIDAMSIEEIHHLERVAERLRQVTRDPLTGLLGRGWLEEELDALVARHHRHGGILTAFFLDVDRFKQINDAFGHTLGDEVLCDVATLLTAGVRETDRVVRYGGEEFVVILGGCTMAASRPVAERLRRSIADRDWSIHGRSGLVVTVSIGIATLRSDESASDWLERADAAMYQAKRAGRNQVVAPRC